MSNTLARCWRCKHVVDFTAVACENCQTASPVHHSAVWTRAPLADVSFLVVTGPTGGGKTYLADYFRRLLPGARLLVKHTDRARRSDEVDGYNYHFASGRWFDDQLQADTLVGHFGRYGNRYALSVVEVQQFVGPSYVPILIANAETAKQVKIRYPRSRTCYVCSRDHDAVRARVTGRDDDPQNRSARLALVEEEFECREIFDYDFEYDEEWPSGLQYMLCERSSSGKE